ncbi:MAG: NUMOD4 domain-containing protein [Candidatus Azobacteroides sp.]|nr:NUMOD4 domain-containing protein [Candidatus Azobacteroides sp.]
MLRFYPQEIFKEIFLEDKFQFRYAISNYGRFVSFTDKIEEGRFVKGTKQDGYRIWRYKIRDSNHKFRHKYCFLYKLVAEYFIPKTSEEQVYVLHLNYNRSDDYIRNLQWATYAEMLAHSKKSPFVIASRKKQLAAIKEKRKHQGNKLTSTQVIFLKKKLLDPNRKTRLKILAKRFGVTTMTLQRIKTGENWGHIKI